MKVRTAWVSLLAIALVAWFLSRADLGDVWGHVRLARVDLLGGALVLVAMTFWMRTVRWQYLLAPIGATRFEDAFRATMIGFAALCVLPARVGDLLRPFLLARQAGFSASAALATIILERVLDLVAVVVLLAAFAWGWADESTMSRALLWPVRLSSAMAVAAASILLGTIWVMSAHPERVGGLVATALRVLPKRAGERLGSLATTFSGGFAVARNPRTLAVALLWSFPLWLVLSVEVWLVSLALGIDLPLPGTFLVQALLVIGVAVPTPGAVGSFHEAYRIGVTTFFGAPNDAAVAAAIVLHAVSFVPVVLVGFVFMAQEGVSLGGLGLLAGAARKAEMPEAP